MADVAAKKRRRGSVVLVVFRSLTTERSGRPCNVACPAAPSTPERDEESNPVACIESLAPWLFPMQAEKEKSRQQRNNKQHKQRAQRPAQSDVHTAENALWQRGIPQPVYILSAFRRMWVTHSAVVSKVFIIYNIYKVPLREEARGVAQERNEKHPA